MFETAELGRSITKKEYRERVTKLREELLQLQEQVRQAAQTQIILVFAGVDGGGKGETVNLLNEWMDPRWIVTRAYEAPDASEIERPEFWRYWRDLPARGRIGMFLSSWYSQPILDRAYGRTHAYEFDAALDRVLGFESALAEDGALIQKFWMHLSREGQKKRLENLERDPLTQARVSQRDWDNWRRYDSFVETAERAISHTNTGKTPWTIIEGEDHRYRSLCVGEIVQNTLARAVRRALKRARAAAMTNREAAKATKRKKASARKSASQSHPVTVLHRLDMTQTLAKESYSKQLRKLQAELHLLHLRARQEKVATVLIFEGPDAAGKGGAIRRIDAALQARNYQVHGVAKPTDEESAQHYLWRFWRHLPRDGYFAIFDRSWYGRVLVERVEGFAGMDEWHRAYAEINDFERQLIEHGNVLIKYWIHITKDEQMARFKLREATPHKRWKLTDEDWRNRKKWVDYELAVHDMVQYTSTREAPWTLVEGNDKRFARIKVLQTLCDRLRERLGAPDTAAVASSPAAPETSGLQPVSQ